jgi:hypothetical protein
MIVLPTKDVPSGACSELRTGLPGRSVISGRLATLCGHDVVFDTGLSGIVTVLMATRSRRSAPPGSRHRLASLTHVRRRHWAQRAVLERERGRTDAEEWGRSKSRTPTSGAVWSNCGDSLSNEEPNGKFAPFPAACRSDAEKVMDDSGGVLCREVPLGTGSASELSANPQRIQLWIEIKLPAWVVPLA